MTIQALVQQLFVGIASGLVLYLSASGMSLIMSGLAVINFGQGSFYVAGLYFTWWVANRFNFWPALILVPIGVGLVGGIVELLLRPLYGKNMLYQLLVTMGFSYILCDGIVMAVGYRVRATPLPSILKGAITIKGANITFPKYYLFTIAFSLAIGAALWFVFNHTKIGMYFRAIISDRAMVENLGINVNLLYVLMFIIGTGLGGLAGALNAPIQGISPKAGLTVFTSVMPALQIGGMGNIKGCLPAAIVLGVITGIAAIVIPTYYNCVASAVMVVILFFRPNGLFTKKEA